MQNLIVVGLAGNCEKTIDICLKSVVDADKICIVYDTTSKDNTDKKLLEWKDKLGDKLMVWDRPYDHDLSNSKANGQARNFYFNKVQELFPEDWCLVLDMDETVDKFDKIKELVNTLPPGLFNVHMRHFINNFGTEDATVERHYVQGRLFKVSEGAGYPETEHPTLLAKEQNVVTGIVDVATIYHLGYIPNVWHIKERYSTHKNKSQSHSQKFLREWMFAHLFGTYPVSKVKPIDLPDAILEEFGIERDELYFENRGIETKNLIDAVNWKRFFNPSSVLEVGCGLGPRLWSMESVGMNAEGFDISDYAIKNGLVPNKMWVDDIANLKEMPEPMYDLVIIYDCLEHISLKDIDVAIENSINLSSKYILISVPTVGDPNLEADKTHQIKRPMAWWRKQYSARGHKVTDVPPHFLFPNQQFIVEVANE